MSTHPVLLRSLISLGIGSLLGGTLWVRTLAAQTDPQDPNSTPPITAAPGTSPQGQGGIDYKNAQPMPLPSLPAPPTAPSQEVPHDRGERPGYSSGGSGTGNTSPQRLFTPGTTDKKTDKKQD